MGYYITTMVTPMVPNEPYSQHKLVRAGLNAPVSYAIPTAPTQLCFLCLASFPRSARRSALSQGSPLASYDLTCHHQAQVLAQSRNRPRTSEASDLAKPLVAPPWLKVCYCMRPTSALTTKKVFECMRGGNSASFQCCFSEGN